MNSSKKIAFIMQDIDEGGVQKVFISLANEIADLGYDVSLIVLKESNAFSSLVNSKVRYINLGNKKVILSYSSLLKALNQINPDVCLSAIVHVNIFVSLVNISLGKRFEHIITEHTNCSNAELRAKRLNLKIAYKIQKFFYGQADKIVCVSEGVKEDVIKRIPIVNEISHVIPNPVIDNEIMDFKKNEVRKRCDDEIKILFVGRLVPEKGVDYLIKSFAIFKSKGYKASLIIVGDGPERSNLEKLSKSLSIERDVILEGYVVKPYKYFADADLFTLTSKHEGFALVLVEAMFLSKRVLSVNCPSGPSEILMNGKFGQLVDRNGPKHFAEEIEIAIKSKPNSNLAERALDFSSIKIAKDYIRLIHES